MDIGLLATLSAVVATVALSFRYRADIVSFTSLMILVLAGVYEVGEALSFLISPAVIVLFGSMVLSGVIADSGLLDRLARYVSIKARHIAVASLLLYFVAGVASGFVSDVAIVLAMAVLISDVARRLGAPPAAYVMPLAFAVALGGRLTMVGNAGNVILLYLPVNYGRGAEHFCLHVTRFFGPCDFYTSAVADIVLRQEVRPPVVHRR
ncbi:SLC13 family permease [Pyrobaculum sp.]|uniref:SLC13 family permease n=1 Tax=Pyrobaculum sp. TaxID=2004705 RepID=UPI0031769454